ncbi:MAG: hypothetical protein J3Q66DRAFT_329441 [Benniella sp.]|nr:MAG: hypothetical protein J3Q66DRAFT_329441 [Benniella sp.]
MRTLLEGLALGIVIRLGAAAAAARHRVVWMSAGLSELALMLPLSKLFMQTLMMFLDLLCTRLCIVLRTVRRPCHSARRRVVFSVAHDRCPRGSERRSGGGGGRRVEEEGGGRERRRGKEEEEEGRKEGRTVANGQGGPCADKVDGEGREREREREREGERRGEKKKKREREVSQETKCTVQSG